MTGNSLTEDDAHYQSYDEFSFSQPFGTSDGAAGSATGGVDTGQISRGTHPTAVDEPFQQQHHDSSNPLSSACDPGFPWPAVPSYGWPNDEMSPNLFASFSDFPAYSPTGPSAAPPSATGLTGLTGLTGATQTATSFIDMREQPGIVPVTSPAACKKVDEETLLKSLRDAGYGYTAISEAMRKQLGIEITANALVKRYQKMPNACESLLAKAIANRMPQIMEQLYAELPHIDDGTLSMEEKATVDRMLQELPRVLPNCARSSLSRKRRNMQPSPSL